MINLIMPIFYISGITYIGVFISGFVFGMLVIVGMYTISVLKTVNIDRHIHETTGDMSVEEATELIDTAKNTFKNKKIQGDKTNVEHCRAIVTTLAHDIAQAFYPESETPFFELSVDEILYLNDYVTKRLEEILGRRGLRIFKKYRVTQIVGMIKRKQTIENTSIVKKAKKHKVIGRGKKVLNALNVINPFYWAKKLIINVSMKVIIRKICLLVIVIVGEETYKIYSKNVFNEYRNIDAGVDEIVETIKDDLN